MAPHLHDLGGLKPDALATYLAALGIMLASPGGPEHARWLAYTALVCGQVLRAYANRSLITPIHRLPRNGVLLAAVVLVVAIQVAIPFVPPIAEAFHAVPLSALDWLVVAIIALVPALFAETWRTVRGTRFVA